MEKIKKLKIYYWVFLALTVFGILNILTTNTIRQSYGVDMGGVSFYLMIPFAYIFGSGVGAFVGVLTNLILSLVIFWLPLWWIYKKKIDKLLETKE